MFQTRDMGHPEELESPQKKTTSGKAETNYTLRSGQCSDGKVGFQEPSHGTGFDSIGDGPPKS